ncbi:polycystin family receptor for egg jelly-like [Lytechinus pictus]|uniref:polycystin family receptor for egg jelly-like n=1 Tax=Lytechinus pictus TaxID=7653 RepID=UPI0030B9B268
MTGEGLGMGTEFPVFIALYDQDGKRSEDLELDTDTQDVFNHGEMDAFNIAIGDNDFGEPIFIELWRDNRLPGDDWYCEFIRIENLASQETDMFPIHRWIRAGFPVKLKKYDTLLPQDDPNLNQRRFELEWKWANYQPMWHIVTGMLSVSRGGGTS